MPLFKNCPKRISVTKENGTAFAEVAEEDSVQEWYRTCQETEGPALIEMEALSLFENSWVTISSTFKTAGGRFA